MKPPKRKDKGWRQLSEEYPLAGHETDIYFRMNVGSKAWREVDWPALRWHSFQGYEPRGIDGYDYSQISHLPFWTHIHPDLVAVKLTMIWIKRLGKSIPDYYDLKKAEWDVIAIYYEVLNTPFYDEINVTNLYRPIGEKLWREPTF